MPLPMFSLSKRWKVARLTSAISSSPSVTVCVGAKLSFCGTSAVGVADAKAPPTSPTDKPAAPTAGTAALATRFCFEACFPCGVAAFLHKYQQRVCSSSTPASISLDPDQAQGRIFAQSAGREPKASRIRSGARIHWCVCGVGRYPLALGKRLTSGRF